MEQRSLGADGPVLSVLGLGCNNFGMKIDVGQSAAVVGAALDAGITHFDTAEMYGQGQSEQFLGTALRNRRDEAFIATKFLPRRPGEPFTPGDLARRLVEGVEGSLRRLGTDRIDLYYQHYFDRDAPVDELLDAFEQLISAGKVIHVGLSNLTAHQLANVVGQRPGFPLRGVQIEWNMLSRGAERDVIPAASAAGLGIVPYFPLASGLLTGKYLGGKLPEGSRLATLSWAAGVATPENMANVERLSDMAVRHGRTLIELAFGWLLAHREVSSIIAGATSPDQVRRNAQSIDWQLSQAEMDEAADSLLADQRR